MPVLLVVSALVGPLAGSGAQAGQRNPAAPEPGAGKADPSPFAPGDLKHPIFDTETPVYDIGNVQAKSARTVVAEVDGRPITLGSVADAIAELPAAEQRLSYDVVFPRVRTQLIRQEALVIQAHQNGVDEDLAIKRKIEAVTDRMLADAYLRHEILAGITEQDLLARYDRDIAGKPGPEEVHLRLIMLPTEQAARAAIAELTGGSDFAALAKRISQDTTAATGGDLGWVVRGGLNPDLAPVAFALAPGQMTGYPVSSAGVWFVLRVEGRRSRPTPSFSSVRGQLTETLLRERVPDAVAHALASVTVREYDMMGKERASAEKEH